MKSRFPILSVLKRLFTGLFGQCKKITISSLIIALLGAVFLWPLSLVHAEQASRPWVGEELVRSHKEIKMKPGSEMTFEIHFKNTGYETWNNNGRHFVALATVDPAKRDSAFRHRFWPDEVNYRPAYLHQEQVQFGETGIFRFALKAPEEEGYYDETFQAVAKHIAWIEGTKFTIPIKVTSDPNDFIVQKTPEPVQQVPQAETTPAETTPVVTETVEETPCSGFAKDVTIKNDYPIRNSQYEAEWLCGNKVTIKAEPGQQLLKSFQVKNVGSNAWNNYGWRYVSAYTVRPNYHESPFATDGPGWLSPSQIRLATDQVNPGKTGEVKLLLEAPEVAGTYTDNIRLAVEDYSWMKNGEFIIELIVEAPQVVLQPQTNLQTVDIKPTVYRDTTYQATYLVSTTHALELDPGGNEEFSSGVQKYGE